MESKRSITACTESTNAGTSTGQSWLLNETMLGCGADSDCPAVRVRASGDDTRLDDDDRKLREGNGIGLEIQFVGCCSCDPTEIGLT